MAQMTPGDREYRNETLALSSFFVTNDVVTNVTFINCTLIGPGVAVFVDGCRLEHCDFDAPPGRDMFLSFPDDRQFLVGLLGFSNCRFYNCVFARLGVAVPDSVLERVVQELNG